MYYEINEQTARHAWDNVHMSDYREGSATAEYRAAVDEVAEMVERQKSKVSRFYYEKLDHLLDCYARRLADWTNAYNNNTAKYPSQFICGAGNFNMKKHNAQMAREDTLVREYQEIEAIKDKIKSIGTGAVDLADPDARAILTDQLDRAQTELDRAKKINAYFRKHQTFTGCPEYSPSAAESMNRQFEELHKRAPYIDKPYPDYELASLRGKIKRITARLAELDKRQAAADNPADDTELDGVRIVRNTELDRLQILFEDIPDEDTRARLKSNGFRWSPSNKAWQRQLTDNAERAAREVLALNK